MRRYILAAVNLLIFASAKAQTPNVPDFFQLPDDWHPGEVSGVALNSKGHIFIFQRAKPMLSEFDPAENSCARLAQDSSRTRTD